MTWLQPPGYVHAMLSRAFYPDALRVELGGNTSETFASSVVSAQRQDWMFQAQAAESFVRQLGLWLYSRSTPGDAAISAVIGDAETHVRKHTAENGTETPIRAHFENIQL